MPRQRAYNSQVAYGFPEDLPDHLERFIEVFVLSRAELHRRLGTRPQDVKRWRRGASRASMGHMMAMMGLPRVWYWAIRLLTEARARFIAP